MKLAEKRMLVNTSVDVFKDFINQTICVVLDPRLEDHEEGSEAISRVNVVLGKVLLSGHLTNTICAALSLLYDYSASTLQCSEKSIELVQKCIWKKAQNLSADIAEIEIGPVLKICNSFINDYPAAYWRSQPNDKPLKTVKTVVATLVQNDPDRVYTAFSTATFSPKTDLEAFIQKHLRKIPNNTTLPSANTQTSQFIHNSLAAIFRKIGSRENSKEGIMDLYLFKEKYPNANLDPFLSKTSPFFKNYIERSLRAIESEKAADSGSSGYTHSSSSYRGAGENQVGVDSKYSTDWDEKLRQHRERMKKLNIGTISSSTGNLAQRVTKPPPDVVLGTRTSNVMEDVLPRESTSDRPPPPTSSSSNSELRDLKARLERIKKGHT
ncbi:msps [Bugula neritina]|uniref:Msps n=1 Tax=Bugula neritina TaxID=10212 RepID=A0A7J7KNG0_BUGNE|nr:msps [Bugula neritina]